MSRGEGQSPTVDLIIIYFNFSKFIILFVGFYHNGNDLCKITTYIALDFLQHEPQKNYIQVVAQIILVKVSLEPKIF